MKYYMLCRSGVTLFEQGCSNVTSEPFFLPFEPSRNTGQRKVVDINRHPSRRRVEAAGPVPKFILQNGIPIFLFIGLDI